MRTQPVLGKKLWFAAKGTLGWGWTPVSWEGWLVVVVFAAAILVVSAVVHGAASVTPIFLLVVALVLVCWLKGTSPGGPAAKRMLDIQREREADERRKRA
jgi:hypothetical protein